MKRIGVVFALVLLLPLFSSAARAEFGVPYVTPSSPVAGEALSVNIYVHQQEYCDAILSIPGYPQITREGGEITILFYGSRYESMDTCQYMPGLATESIGIYPPGTYRLTVNLRYGNAGGEFVTDTLGVVPFTVSAVPSEPVAVSAWNRLSAISCVLLLLICGVAALRGRRTAWLCALILVGPSVGRASEPTDRMVEVLLTTAPGAPMAEHDQIQDTAAR